jgi:quinol monooxygenase YgiN
MRTVSGVLAMVAMAMMAASAQAQTPGQTPAPMPAQTAMQDSAPHHVVTIVETGAPDAAKAVTMLQALAANSRQEAGNAGYAVLHERGHPGRFAIVETWRDKAALDRHETAAKPAEDKLQPLLVAPSDRRVCAGLDVAEPRGDSNAAGVYVVTHVDVVPPKKDEAIALLNELASVSRKEAGAYRFDVWQQASRPNHSYVVEAWRDDAARDAHLMADHTRAYRAKLLPLEGSLYDERVYEPLR